MAINGNGEVVTVGGRVKHGERALTANAAAYAQGRAFALANPDACSVDGNPYGSGPDADSELAYWWTSGWLEADKAEAKYDGPEVGPFPINGDGD